ncbi:MAG: hypothetical protein ACU841_15575 [Gammaproteobacteria bacterium]
MLLKIEKPVLIFVFLVVSLFSARLPAALPSFTEGQPLPSLAPMLERSMPAVVNISTSTHIQVMENPLMQEMIQYHHLVADEIGKECLIMSTQWGPLTVAARILGVEAAMMASIESPNEFMELKRKARQHGYEYNHLAGEFKRI